MNRPDLYNKTVDILYQAYFNDTLMHGNCAACAVGNMVAANMGKKFTYDTSGILQWVGKGYTWKLLFATSGKTQYVDRFYLNCSHVLDQINATGYEWLELASIEYAFEVADKGCSDEDYMFNGLVAVLEVLKQIHEIDDNTKDITRFKDHHLNRCSV